MSTTTNPEASASWLLTAAEVAQRMKVCQRHLWALLASGRLPRPVRLGRSVRWRAAELRCWIDAGCPALDRWEAVKGAGWLHRLRDDDGWRSRQHVQRVSLSTRTLTGQDLGRLAERYTGAVKPGELARLAKTLGLSTDSLRRLGIGWDEEAWTFPMVNAAGAVVGIRRRLPGGRKLSVKGGNEGVFVPAGLGDDGPLLICEGPTDTAALLDMGFNRVVGRPSCTGGVGLVVELVKRWQPPGAVIVADGDQPGRRGAMALASVLVLYVSAIRIIQPPTGIKDARAWLRAGGSHQDVQAAIDAAKPLRLTLRTALARKDSRK